MPLQQVAGAQSWAVPAVHDTVAAIARQAAFERTIGQSAMQRILNALGRAIQAIFLFFRGSETGRHVALTIAILIVVAIAIHFILITLATRSDIVAADSSPARARAADAWREAERLAAAGQFTDASHALLAALLSVFAQRGEVRLHASKTAGDYARELARRGSPARSAFQQFRRRYDAVIFGVGTCTADQYAALLRDAEPILARAGVA
jgi:2-keto-3-deoxy-6-phosphogluconate aldolase